MGQLKFIALQVCTSTSTWLSALQSFVSLNAQPAIPLAIKINFQDLMILDISSNDSMIDVVSWAGFGSRSLHLLSKILFYSIYILHIYLLYIYIVDIIYIVPIYYIFIYYTISLYLFIFLYTSAIERLIKIGLKMWAWESNHSGEML